MGGKHKQAQRTKNNARPSSSGRSAELLGNTVPTFVGFTAAKDGGFVPVLPGFTIGATDELDPNLNPNFHLVLKKMGKKDSTTKLKALQEFSELIRNSEPEAVKAVLPLWPRLYCHLAVDVEHRVREAAHQAQRAVVLRAKRNLAPYLRQLAGPWFTSQYDTYPPAATAASLAFQDAFPPNKATGAIIFCQAEILDYIYDNLIVQTAQTLSNPKTITAEEMEAKYQRVVISSLHGYALYLQKLPTEQLKAAEEANKKLIVSKKFWKLSKHNIPLIRNAWFSVLIALCQNAPHLLVDEGSHVALSVFGNLDETDPIVLPTVWEASLHVLTTVEDCWRYVSVEKLVLPKLWHILREGGQGNAAAIFPNLLPFLSKIPSTVFSDKKDFYDKFFDSMRQGMSKKSVNQSPSECTAVAKGYIECLQYITMLHLEEKNFCHAILKNHLTAVVEQVLKDQKLHLVSAALFPQVSGLIHHWSRNCNNENYKALVDLFWESLTVVLESSLSSSADEESLEPDLPPSSWLLNRQVDLCLCLKDPKQQRSSLKLKVKFSSDSEEGSPEPESPVENEPCSSDGTIAVDQGLQTLVQIISASYFKKYKQFNDPTFLSYLSSLTKSFKTRDYFLSLFSEFVSENEDNNDSLITLYDAVLYKLLETDNMCTEDVISIIFNLLEFLTVSEKNLVLDSLCKVPNGSILVWCVKASLGHRSDPTVQNWLHSSHLSHILVVMARDVCLKKTAQDAESILKFCLCKTEDGDLAISTETFSAILSELSQLLQSPKKSSSGVAFASEMMKSLYSSDIRLSPYLHSNKAAEGLLVCLFKLSCQNFQETNEAWHAGISALARLHGNCSEDFIRFSQKFAQVVKEELLLRKDMQIESIDHLASTVGGFLQAAVNCFPDGVSDKASMISASVKLCVTFLDCLSSELNNNEHVLTAICLYTGQVKGLLKLNLRNAKCSSKDIAKNLTNSEVKVVQYVTLVLFSVSLVTKLFDSSKSEESEDQVEEIDICLLENQFLTFAYSVAVCESFSRHYKSSSYYYEMIPKYTVFLQRFTLLMKSLEAESLEYVSRITSERAKQNGNLWLQAVHLMHSKVLEQTNLKMVYEDLTSDLESSNIGTIEVCQIFFSHVKVEDITTDAGNLEVDKLIMVASWLRNLEGTLPIEYSESVLNLLTSILIWYQQDDKTKLLFECQVRWPEAKAVAAVSRFLSAVVEKCPELLTADLWDVVIITVVAWMLTMHNSLSLLLSSEDSYTPPLVPTPSIDSKVPLSVTTLNNLILMENHSGALFATAVCKLFKTVSVFLTNPRPENDVSDAKKFHDKLSVEWNDVFADDVHTVLISTFDTIADLVGKRSLSLLDLPLLESLGEAMLYINPKYFVKSEKKSNSTSLDDLVQRCCQVIHSAIVPLQLTAYHILTRLVPGLTELDTPEAYAASAVEEEREGLSLSKLQETLLHTQTVVNTMLLGISLGNSCTTVCPFTDSYTYTTAYLLLWTVVLDMCGKAVTELRYQYATMLRDSGFLKSLLQNVFRLMPEEVLQTTDPKFKLQRTSEMFYLPPSLDFSQAQNSELVEHLSCWVYYNTLRRLPALVRQWWGDMEPRVASLVDQVTSIHCTPALCAAEMKSIQKKEMQQGNMMIKVHPTVREVVATYKVDEARMELSIQLPNNYPLGPVRVECGNSLIDCGQWRNWMMQLTIFLSHQNGSIWNGLTLWKSNVDKKFEGVEECYICFSIMHGSNFQLPRQCCSTCKKKFHSACLYKWFSTSNKATCPICRNLF